MKTNKIIAGALSLCIMGTNFIGLNTNAADIAASGQCGDNAYWSLDSEGTFTVTGTGATWSWDFGAAYIFAGDMEIQWDDFEPMPWFEIRDQIKRVVIGEGITGLGDVIFWDCDNLTSVEFPSTLTTTLGSFECCDNLRNIRFPEGMEDIGWGSFLFCSSMSSVELPESVSTIGLFAFDGMASLSRIVISNPECTIYDSIDTINNISYADSEELPFAGVIIGYYGSTAQAYAEKYGITFKAIEDFSLGDVNLDGEVNALDASMALTEYASVATGKGSVLYDYQETFANVNGDSAVNSLDASYILGYYAYTAIGGYLSFEEYMK
ncbi:MAG: leucine-rich repeat protein [Ruminococcus sp.]|nr:leucine-rich repeat protein [Ruminococcus sp.]